jgi:hypothetical protein
LRSQIAKKGVEKMGFFDNYQYKLRAAISESGSKTVRGFSQKIGVSRVIVSRVVNGREKPTQFVAEAIAGGLGITVNELLVLLDDGN